MKRLPYIVRLSLLALLGSAVLGCETDTVTGIEHGNLTVTILNSDSTRSAGAEVRLVSDHAYRATTDSTGSCRFIHVPTHRIHILATQEGYRRVRQTFWMTPEDVSRTIVLQEVAELHEGFEEESLPEGWTTFGDEDWFMTQDVSYEGLGSIRSGNVGSYDESYLEFTVEVEWSAELSFWYRTQLDYYDDYFHFYVDGEEMIRIYDDTGWTQFRMDLEVGTHSLRWEFERSYYEPEEAAVWLDEFYLRQ